MGAGATSSVNAPSVQTSRAAAPCSADASAQSEFAKAFSKAQSSSGAGQPVCTDPSVPTPREQVAQQSLPKNERQLPPPSSQQSSQSAASTSQTARDGGNSGGAKAGTQTDVKRWVAAHPKEAQALVDKYKDDFSPVPFNDALREAVGKSTKPPELPTDPRCRPLAGTGTTTKPTEPAGPVAEGPKMSADQLREQRQARDRAEYLKEHPNLRQSVMWDSQTLGKATGPDSIAGAFAGAYMAAGMDPETANANAAKAAAFAQLLPAGKGGASQAAIGGITPGPGVQVGTTGADRTRPVSPELPPAAAPLPQRPAVPAGAPDMYKNWRPPTQEQARAAQEAVDKIHATLPEGSRANTVFTLSFTPDNRVVLAANDKGIPAQAREVARQIYPNVEFVPGGIKHDAYGAKGWHAEPRSGQFLPAGTYQASSHYSCHQCEAFQASQGILNVTGYESVTGRVTRK